MHQVFYEYLFDTTLKPAPKSFEPQNRLSLDFYNYALTKAVKLVQKQGVKRGPDNIIRLPEQNLEVKLNLQGFLWNPKDISAGYLMIASEYESKDLRIITKLLGLVFR